VQREKGADKITRDADRFKNVNYLYAVFLTIFIFTRCDKFVPGLGATYLTSHDNQTF
jgi:hypothetical protein